MIRHTSIALALLVAACGDSTGPDGPTGDRLAGDPTDPAVAAIEREPYEPRADDFSLGHPDLPGMLLSHRVAIVAFGAGATVGAANALLDELDAEIIGGIPGVAGQAAGLLALRVPSASHESMESSLASIRSRAFVESATQDIELGTTEVPDQNDNGPGAWMWDSTGVLDTWGLIAIRAPQMWNFNASIRTSMQPAVLTGVLDVGFAEGHEDLPIFQYLGIHGVDDHGTHVAGTIGAGFNNGKGIDGVTPFAALVTRRVFNSGPSATYAGALWGLEDVIVSQPGLRVVNLSLGYNWYLRTPVIDARTNAAAQTRAATNGAQVLTVLAALQAQGYRLPFIAAAAGNDSEVLPSVDARFASPFANAALALGAAPITVVESDSLVAAGGPSYVRSAFSNINGHLSAPGSVIWSSVPAGYAAMSGTSMATPHLTGLVSYLYALAPSLPSPTITSNPVRDLLVANLQPGMRNGRPQIDAFATALAVDGVLGGDAVLRRLVDIDDGTPDGNLRANAAGAVNTSENRASDGGRIDMADFRRWRDWLLQTENPAGLALDGLPTHPKKDPNGDGAPGGAPAYEAIYSRGDFNGDGKIDRVGTRAMPGALGGQARTDLEVLQHLFQDANYAKADLPGLIASGDLHLDASSCLSVAGAASVRTTATPGGGGAGMLRTHTAGAPTEIVTVSAPKAWSIRVETLNAAGAVVASVVLETAVALGEDVHLRPACAPGGGGASSAQFGPVSGSLGALTQFQGQFLCSRNSGTPLTSPDAVQCTSTGQTFDENGNPVTRAATGNSGWTFQSTAAASGQPASFTANIGTSASADFRTWGTADGVLTVSFTVTGGPMRYELTGTLSTSGSAMPGWDAYARVRLIEGNTEIVDVQAGRRAGDGGTVVTGPANVQLTQSGVLQPGSYTFQAVNRVGDVFTTFHTEAAAGATTNNPTLTLRPQ